MRRRDFFRAASAAGLSLFTPLPWGAARAQQGANDFKGFDGPYYVMINCIGAWDVTHFCDPKGSAAYINEEMRTKDKPINWYYGSDEISTVNSAGGRFRLAPSPHYAPFFDRWKDRITVINGVDNGTNGHTQGERVTWSGSLAPGYPSVAAMIAAERLGSLELPMPFLTFGGYDQTSDLLAPTRLKNMSAFTKIVAPGTARASATDPIMFHDPVADDAIRRASAARLEALRANRELPRAGTGLDSLFVARLSERNIERVMDRLDQPALDALGNSRTDRLLRQALITLTAFESKVAVSANLAVPSWDSHSMNQERQDARFGELFALLTALREGAEARGIGDKLHIFVGSDFSRTPYENATEGKDHWSVGSWMHVSASPNGGRGTIGATTASMKGKRLRPGTLELTENSEHDKLTPATLHNDLRRLAGVADTPSARAYPLRGESPPIFA